jgi:hypothetical protein
MDLEIAGRWFLGGALAQLKEQELVVMPNAGWRERTYDQDNPGAARTVKAREGRNHAEGATMLQGSISDVRASTTSAAATVAVPATGWQVAHVRLPEIRETTPADPEDGGIALYPEFATGANPLAFPTVLLHRQTCRNAGPCQATCPAGQTAISGGLDRELRAGPRARQIDDRSWAADATGDGPAITVWVMCI